MWRQGMIGDEKIIQECSSCNAEFVVDGYNTDEDITFCPYCGSMIEDDMDEEFFDDDNI